MQPEKTEPEQDESTALNPLNAAPSSFVLGRVESLGHALRGIATMLQTQRNAWIHALATAFVLGVAGLLGLNGIEWGLVVMAVVAVWTAEALNTAFERMCDVASPGFHPLVKQAKDVAAGAVLITALGAIAIAAVVFGPHIFGN